MVHLGTNTLFTGKCEKVFEITRFGRGMLFSAARCNENQPPLLAPTSQHVDISN